MKRSDLQDNDVIRIGINSPYWIEGVIFGYRKKNDEFLFFGNEFEEHLSDEDLDDATLIYREGELSLEAMLDKLGDVNLRLDPDGYRCWIVGHTAVAEHFGVGMTRYESVKMCYEKWQARNVELFGEMK